MFPGLENSISLDEPDTTNPMNYLIDNLKKAYTNSGDYEG
jgi:hypothetical protein